MIIKNYTPHEITLFSLCDMVYDSRTHGYKLLNNSKPRCSYPSLGCARCEQSEHVHSMLDDVVILHTTYGELQGLPDPEEGVLYVVSQLAHQSARHVGRVDTITVARPIRDDNGRVIGCGAFAI